MRYAILLLLLLPTTVMGQRCNNSLAAHVYRPDRLQPTGKGCITITGRVVLERKEKDGDVHTQIRLDSGQPADLINSVNVSKQGGNLVIEPMCVKGNPVRQADAKAAC